MKYAQFQNRFSCQSHNKYNMKMILPSIGAAVSNPLSLDDIRKSQVADGKTNDIIVIPIAVFI